MHYVISITSAHISSVICSLEYSCLFVDLLGDFLAQQLGDLVLEYTLPVTMQWLVFRNDGITTAAQWAQQVSQSGTGGGMFSKFDSGRIERQQAFALEVLRQTLKASPASPLHTQVIHASASFSGVFNTLPDIVNEALHGIRHYLLARAMQNHGVCM